MSGTRSPPTRRILIENIGPFKKASLELKPLTILIGVNSVGKSMLMYLAWAVMSLEPDIAALGEATRSLGALEMAKRLAELVKRGRDPTAELRQLLRVFVRALPKALAKELEERLQRIFGVELHELLHRGAAAAIPRLPRAGHFYLLSTG